MNNITIKKRQAYITWRSEKSLFQGGVGIPKAQTCELKSH